MGTMQRTSGQGCSGGLALSSRTTSQTRVAPRTSCHFKTLSPVLLYVLEIPIPTRAERVSNPACHPARLRYGIVRTRGCPRSPALLHHRRGVHQARASEQITSGTSTHRPATGEGVALEIITSSDGSRTSPSRSAIAGVNACGAADARGAWCDSGATGALGQVCVATRTRRDIHSRWTGQ